MTWHASTGPFIFWRGFTTMNPLVSLVLFASLAFFVLSSQRAYLLTDRISDGLFSIDFIDEDGDPTMLGQLAHTLVFAGLLYAYFHFLM